MLLHPGHADSRAFDVNVPGLAERFRVYRPDRRGHGRTPDVEGPISYAQMAEDTIAFVEAVVGEPVYLVGHSDGAPVALLVALRRPDLVRKLVLGAGVFHHHGWAPGAIDLDEEVTAFFTDYYGAVSPDGPEHFPVVAEKLDRMHREEPTLTVADLAGYTGPALVMVGDDEDEIPIEHTLALRSGLPGGQLAVVPGAGHGLLAEKPELCNQLIVDFLEGDAPTTEATIARVWKGAVRPADADAYADYIRETGFAEYAGTPGNRGAWMLRLDDGERTEFITLSLWDSADSIRAFAGDDIDAAVLYPEDERYLIGGESTVTHYQVADRG